MQVQTNGTKCLISENEAVKLKPTGREKNERNASNDINQHEAHSGKQAAEGKNKTEQTNKQEKNKKDFHTIHVQLEVKIFYYFSADRFVKSCQLVHRIPFVMLIFLGCKKKVGRSAE